MDRKTSGDATAIPVSIQAGPIRIYTCVYCHQEFRETDRVTRCPNSRSRAHKIQLIQDSEKERDI